MFAAAAPLGPFARPGAPGLCPRWKVTCQPRARLSPAAHAGTTPLGWACVGVCHDGTDNPCTQVPGRWCWQCQEGGRSRVNTQDPEAAAGGCSFLLPPWWRANPCQGFSATRLSVMGTRQQMGGMAGGCRAQGSPTPPRGAGDPCPCLPSQGLWARRLCSPSGSPQGLGTLTLGCQPWGHPGKCLKTFHGKMGAPQHQWVPRTGTWPPPWQAVRTWSRQCPRQGTWRPRPPHPGECSPAEPPRCVAPLGQEELQPCPCRRGSTMGCWGQWLLCSWMLWGLWVLPGKCQGCPHCCWADQVADTIWVMGCKQLSGCSNAASLSPSARPGFALSLPAGATEPQHGPPTAAGEAGGCGSNGDSCLWGRCLSCSRCWSGCGCWGGDQPQGLGAASSHSREEGWR